MKASFLIPVLAIASLSSAAPMKFKVASGASQLAQVESVTSAETFTGTTNKVSGSFRFDPTRKTGSGKLVVDVASLDTKIPLRNEHLRSKNWLDASAFPTIIFETTKVTFLKGETYTVEGKLTIHGVTKTVKTTASLKMMKASEKTKTAGFTGDVLQVKTELSVALGEFKINIPAQAKGKVAETVKIRVTAYGTSDKA